MREDRMREDVEYLAGRLPHRGGNTENERLAAEYIYERFRSLCPQAEIDDFYAIESPGFLFASYYWEFLLVALVSTWWPAVGAVYGGIVFLMYLAEFTGYPVLSRVLPQFETQNVMGRFLSVEPKRLVIVTAHYDTARATVLSNPNWAPYVRAMHYGLVGCMVTVIVASTLGAMGTLVPEAPIPIELVLRWAGALVLTVAGIALYVSDLRAEYVRGAVNNASGAAALAALAQRLHDDPLKSTDVWLVATGSKETWVGGMHHLLRRLDADPETTYFLNLAHVGAGELKYITGEGMLHLYKSDKELVALAEDEAAAFNASPATYRGLPTDALAPLTRGFKALSVTGSDPRGHPPYWNWHTDTVSKVDYGLLERAVGYVETILRRLDGKDSEHVPARG